MADDRFPIRTMAAGVILGPLASLVGQVPLPHAEAVAASLGTLGAVAALGAPALYLRDRRAGRLGRADSGMATWAEHRRVASARAMRRRAKIMRPSMGELSPWQLRQAPTTEYATALVKVGRWRRVHSGCEDVTLRVGGPRSGKTGELACRVLDAPGAVLVTTTKGDLVELTAPLRERLGPVHVLCINPELGLASTVKWSPLVGCRSIGTAQRRAADMLPDVPGDRNAEMWITQARRLLSVLLHAAALDDLPMRAVLAWASTPDEQAAKRVDQALAKSPDERATRLVARQLFGTADRTLTSITTTMMPALGWLADSRLASVGDAQGDELLDLAEMVEQRGTLYLLGAEDGVTAPLVAALTAELARAARGLAGAGRLDPPLTMALDEAALICPVPLDRWTADLGGRGITIHIAVQSLAQMRARWGDAGAGTILTNAATRLVFGGTADPTDLSTWSSLSGERREIVETRDTDGRVTNTTTRTVPVFSPAQIQAIPDLHAMVIRRGMRVTYGRAVMAWERRTVKHALRHHPYVPVVETRYAETAEQGS